MNKKLLFLLILLIALGISFEVLALETAWPTSPFGTGLTDDSTLTDMVRYFYEWGIFIGGIAVFVSLLIGGFLYLTSIGNPARMAEAKDRIFSALIGLVLLLCIYLILNTINPELTILMMPELTTIEGFNCDTADDCDTCKNDPNPGDGNKEGKCDQNIGQFCDTAEDCYECRNDPNPGDGNKEGVCTVKATFETTPCKSVIFYDDIDCKGGSYTPSCPIDCDEADKTIKSIKVVGSCSIFLYEEDGCGTPTVTIGGDVKTDPADDCDFPDIKTKYGYSDFKSIKIQDASF